MRLETALVIGTRALAIAAIAASHSLLAQTDDASNAGVERGLRLLTGAATQGYTLFSPLTSTTAYLIDLNGRVVQTWQSEFQPSAWVYMLNDGHVLRGGRAPETHGFSGGGQGGQFQEFEFDGDLVWDFSINTPQRLPHHDVAVLPNGNLLAVVWEHKTVDDARRAGRRTDLIPDDGVWGDVILELEPEAPNGARVVWEWHAWDHIVQDIDADLDTYGELSEHPELININGDTIGAQEPPDEPIHDIFHINSIAYNAELDQIIVSAPTFNEVWIIDHGTTTAEAAGSSGGRYGMGGDLLYRWGNPQVYGRGDADDRMLGFQHDARWIPDGRPGAGNITVFSNRTPGPDGSYTQIYEIAPPVDSAGRYDLRSGEPFGPTAPVWTYSDPETFEATYISGAERLATGNTLITSGPQGRLFEVTRDGAIVWEYWSPYAGDPDSANAGGQRNPYSVFRAIRIPADHAALDGRDLRPLAPQPRPARLP